MIPLATIVAGEYQAAWVPPQMPAAPLAPVLLPDHTDAVSTYPACLGPQRTMASRPSQCRPLHRLVQSHTAEAARDCAPSHHASAALSYCCVGA